MAQGRSRTRRGFKRSLAIWESALGPDHPLVATSLNNTAELYFKQQDWAQAASYWQRSTDILIRRSGAACKMQKRFTQEAAAPGSTRKATASGGW